MQEKINEAKEPAGQDTVKTFSTCSNSVPVQWDCGGQIVIKQESIKAIYLLKLKKPKRIKIKGKQYARPFYIYVHGLQLKSKL